MPPPPPPPPPTPVRANEAKQTLAITPTVYETSSFKLQPSATSLPVSPSPMDRGQNCPIKIGTGSSQLFLSGRNPFESSNNSATTFNSPTVSKGQQSSTSTGFGGVPTSTPMIFGAQEDMGSSANSPSMVFSPNPVHISTSEEEGHAGLATKPWDPCSFTGLLSMRRQHPEPHPTDQSWVSRLGEMPNATMVSPFVNRLASQASPCRSATDAPLTRAIRMKAPLTFRNIELAWNDDGSVDKSVESGEDGSNSDTWHRRDSESTMNPQRENDRFVTLKRQLLALSDRELDDFFSSDADVRALVMEKGQQVHNANLQSAREDVELEFLTLLKDTRNGSVVSGDALQKNKFAVSLQQRLDSERAAVRKQVEGEFEAKAAKPIATIDDQTNSLLSIHGSAEAINPKLSELINIICKDKLEADLTKRFEDFRKEITAELAEQKEGLEEKLKDMNKKLRKEVNKDSTSGTRSLIAHKDVSIGQADDQQQGAVNQEEVQNSSQPPGWGSQKRGQSDLGRAQEQSPMQASRTSWLPRDTQQNSSRKRPLDDDSDTSRASGTKKFSARKQSELDNTSFAVIHPERAMRTPPVHPDRLELQKKERADSPFMQHDTIAPGPAVRPLFHLARQHPVGSQAYENMVAQVVGTEIRSPAAINELSKIWPTSALKLKVGKRSNLLHHIGGQFVAAGLGTSLEWLEAVFAPTELGRSRLVHQTQRFLDDIARQNA